VPLQTRPTLRLAALSLGLPLTRLGVRRLATLAMAAAVTSCDSSSQDPSLEWGWVTNCVGPDFSKLSQSGGTGSGTDRPVFRINDQLVLAVPKKNRPYTNSIERLPHECRTISDIPLAQFFSFVIWGEWSAGYKRENVRWSDGMPPKDVRPDLVSVRIEPQSAFPVSNAAVTPEQRQKAEQTLKEAQASLYEGTREVGGLSCLVPKGGVTMFHCSETTTQNGDGVKLDYRQLNASFVVIQADYTSSRYGGIHVYWKTVTSDVSHWRDIDEEVWKLISEWNLLNKGQVNDSAVPLASNNRWRGP